VAAQLRDEGYQNAHAMRGGVQAWIAAGFPMDDEARIEAQL
jgi:rhodanese-related sulfurtransferase